MTEETGLSVDVWPEGSLDGLSTAEAERARTAQRAGRQRPGRPAVAFERYWHATYLRGSI